jgi:hypothetical protein
VSREEPLAPGRPRRAAAAAGLGRLAAAAVAIAVVLLDDPLAGRAAALPRGAAEEADWSAEFADVCSRTQDAMALSGDELRSLVESRRKVYARRLKQCRDLYDFVLKSREMG